MSSILIIDDEPGIRTVLRDILEDESYTIFDAADGPSGLALLEKESVDLVLLDVWMPNMGGIDVLKKIKDLHPLIEVIIISGHATVDLAVKAVKLGAFDFLEKPLGLDKTITLCRNALAMENLKKENLRLRSSVNADEIVGSSAPIARVRELIEQSAKSDARILITGGNGTGKELVAREIHRRSIRAQHPFVEVNCAAIPENLIESELFGHEKGAFTGAISRRKGRFELAHRGTLFLDEVADMSAGAQAKMLRVLQELRFERVGGEQSISVDVRVIAATNRDIRKEIETGRFREDLYFRLNVIPVHMPALQERIDDLEALLDYFLKRFANPNDPQPKTISPEGLAFLRGYAWPGNVRELKNFAERVTIIGDEHCVQLDTVKYCIGEIKPAPGGDELVRFKDMNLNEAKDEFEKLFITRRLAEQGYNISRTAEALGTYPSNLHGKIKKHGIRLPR